MTLVYHYDDNGCDVSANGQKQTNKYARSIILLNHKTQIIKAHENKQNLAYWLIANEFLISWSQLKNVLVWLYSNYLCSSNLRYHKFSDFRKFHFNISLLSNFYIAMKISCSSDSNVYYAITTQYWW